MTDGLAEAPPHPKFKLRLNFDLSPHAGRGTAELPARSCITAPTRIKSACWRVFNQAASLTGEEPIVSFAALDLARLGRQCKAKRQSSGGVIFSR
ncbi:hypothetical protein CWO90_15600 [Bradyrhizobium sp. Leo121]|nr:hypothetical protein CWO90_15600 [Bradyrhizobium sp. Leo121]